MFKAILVCLDLRHAPCAMRSAPKSQLIDSNRLVPRIEKSYQRKRFKPILPVTTIGDQTQTQLCKYNTFKTVRIQLDHGFTIKSCM